LSNGTTGPDKQHRDPDSDNDVSWKTLTSVGIGAALRSETKSNDLSNGTTGPDKQHRDPDSDNDVSWKTLTSVGIGAALRSDETYHEDTKKR